MKQNNNTFEAVIKTIGIVFAVLCAAFPLYYLFLTSVKPGSLLLSVPPKLIFLPELSHYQKVIIENKYYIYYFNSIVIGLCATIITLFIASLMAYATSKFEFKGKGLLIFLVVLSRMYMPISTLLPIYMVGKFFGLLDTRFYLVLVYTSLQLPLAFYILTSFFEEVPIEIQESAEIDGCDPITTFFKIAIPLAIPGLIATGILVFIFNWNEFLFALVTTSFNARTAPVALSAFSESEGSIQWGELSALGFSMSLPVLLFIIFLAKYLVKGMLSGSIKE